MTTNSKELKIRYTGDTSGVQSSLRSMDKMHQSFNQKLSGLGRSMTSTGKSMTLGLTAPLIGLGAIATQEFAASERAAAQTAAVIKSTGGAANVTVDEIAAMSQEIGKLAAVEDETVQAGANMLLTFTNVRNEAGKGNDVFNQALGTLQDMASAMGTDTKSSAIQLGKALNDPVKGISALSRVGVTFTDEQKKMIEQMVKAGDTAGAQKVILAELNKEFGGSAKAAGDTASPLTKMRLQFGEIAESIGQFVVPLFEKLAEWLGKIATWFQNLSPEGKKLAVTIGAIVAAVGPLLLIMGKLFTAVGAISSGFKALQGVMAAGKLAFLTNPWFLLAAAIVAVVVLIIKHWDKIKGVVMPIINAIKDFAVAAWEKIKDVAAAVWGVIGGVVKAAWAVIKAIALAYIAVWKAVFNAVAAVAKVIWNAIKTVVKVVWAVIKGVAQAYLAYWKLVFKVVATVAKVIWNAIKKVVQVAWAVIKGIANTLKAVWLGVWNAIKAVASTVWNAIKGFVQGTWDKLRSIGQAIKGFFIDVWNGIKDKASDAWDFITNTFRGTINGIIGAWNSLDFEIGPWTIPSWVPIFGGKTFHIADLFPDIPLLFKGGIVTQPTLAWIGERGPEAVIPLDRLAATGQAAPTTMNVTLNLDRRRFGRQHEIAMLTGGRG